MSTDGISALERGYRRSPQRETLELLAAALALDDEQRRDFEAAARVAMGRRPKRASGASVTVGPWPPPGAAGLPLMLTSYVGRESETAAIGALLRESRLVTITGAGGVGKTRAALEAAAALGDDWSFRPRLVSLTRVADPAAVLPAIAFALGLQEVPNRALRDSLRSYFEGNPLLLILDNCEHVIQGAAQAVETILIDSSHVRVLATSRERLRVAGEHAYRLPSLAVPPRNATHPPAVSELLGYGAVALFADRARAVNHRFRLTDELVPVVAELCRQLDGIPLAIELAAARADSLSVVELAARLGERFRLLTDGERTALPRRQTMRATIDWSYELLSPPERRLFERLSVFAGGCTVAMAARVCAEDDADEAAVLDRLSAVEEKSLAVADLDAAETRYYLLESFRQYAHEKLTECGEVQALRRRHAVAYRDLAKRLDESAGGTDAVFQQAVGDELDNWRAALEWTLRDRNDPLLGQELAAELRMVWHGFAPLEGRRWLTAAIEQIGDATPDAVVAALYLTQSSVAIVLGEHAEELAAAQAAIERYRAMQDALGAARAQSRAGHALTELGEIERGKRLLIETLETARQLDNDNLVTFVLRCLGVASAREGDYAAARRYVSESVQIMQAMGATVTAAAAMEDLAEFEFLDGNAELAVQQVTALLEVLRKAHMTPRPIAISLVNLACYLNALGRYDEAAARAREAFEIARSHDLTEIVGRALQRLAAAAVSRDEASAEPSADVQTRAARLLGFVDAADLAKSATPPECMERDRLLATLQNTLGEAATAAAMAEGALMTMERAIDETLATL